MSKFKQSDVVVLAGQPYVHMTVNHLFGEGESEQAGCIWFDTKNRLQRANFFTSLLSLAPLYIQSPQPPIVIGSTNQ